MNRHPPTSIWRIQVAAIYPPRFARSRITWPSASRAPSGMSTTRAPRAASKVRRTGEKWDDSRRARGDGIARCAAMLTEASASLLASAERRQGSRGRERGYAERGALFTAIKADLGERFALL